MQQKNIPKSKESGSFTPFLVADRQASLKIIAGIDVSDGKKIGIMTHANTHKNFQETFKRFPCVDLKECPINGNKECPYGGDISKCEKGRKMKEATVKICDSGVFTKEGCTVPEYGKLFETYENLGVDYGIIIDYLKDKDSTVESAKKAMDVYSSKKWSFKLIGVAQGNTVDEYLECYRELKNLGYTYIGIGGMLKKRENSARYVTVRDESLLTDILSTIRNEDDDTMLFALGCYSPKRHETFRKFSVFGSDYKGWIFQYNVKSKKRGDKKAQKKRFEQVRNFVKDEVISKPQTWEEKKTSKLLIISCSKKKIDYEDLSPAIMVYDGPVYRTLRKMKIDFKNENGLDILILSAKYGFIEPMKDIKIYDQVMTSDIALTLRKKLDAQFSDFISRKNYSEIAINLGREYMVAFQQVSDKIPKESKIIRFDGKIGEKLKQTKEWLEKNLET